MSLPVHFSTIARLAVSGLLLLLPACGIPALRPAAPAPALPPAFNSQNGGYGGGASGAPGGEQVPAPTPNQDTSPGLLPTPVSFQSDSGPELLPSPNASSRRQRDGQDGSSENSGVGGAESVAPPDAAIELSLDNSAQLGVVEFFNDPLLTSLVEQGMAGNRELMILNEEIEIAANVILARRGSYLPTVTGRAHADLTKSSRFTPRGAVEDQIEYLPGRHFPDPLPDFLLSLDVFWRLDIWRELRNSRDAAAERYIAAVERRNYFVTTMVAEIAESYYGLMALDKRMENLDQTIDLQEASRQTAEAFKQAGRGTELAVQRFEAEVRRNISEKPIVLQDIVETENRINFLVNRFPQPVERDSARFYDLNIRGLSVGVPAQLLANRPDIRQAERELAAAGLDVLVARAHFFPTLDIAAGVGYEAFDPKYLFQTPESLIYNVAGDLVGPIINKKAIQAEYLTANAEQLQAVYNYQRVVLDAFTQVINRYSRVENFRRSVDIKTRQLEALDASVQSARRLFQNPRVEERVEYLEVLLAQRDLRDARMDLIETKREQLAAVVNTYQALGGGAVLSSLDWEAPRAPGP